uniref:Cilia- and flagella-associated protein 45 n=1 Tax=Lotharella globosa TaxID=91324 RepID=A0A7S3Z5W6_9EUKA
MSGVDESLFGSKRNSRKGSRKGHAVISKDKLKGLLGKESVVLKTSELYALKAKTVLNPTSHKAISKEARHKALAERSAMRKKKMASKGKMGRVSTVDKEEVAENAEQKGILVKAQGLKDEQHDDVKHMNQIILYAECATIRDRQLHEREKIKKQQMEEERKVVEQMEQERLKSIQRQEERERIRMIKKQNDAVVLRRQIADIQKERMRQRELAEQEAQHMLQRIKENEKRLEKEAQAKIEYGRKLHAEVMAANDAAARAKLRRKQEEQEEEDRIAQYLKDKELREAQEEARQAEIKAAKDKEVARLRALQEKANDQQSEIDELRARRYQEASDRRWRLAEKEKALKQQEMVRDLARVRNEQRLYKEKHIAEQRKQDQEQHLRLLMWQKEQQAKENAAAERKRLARVAIQDTVLEQIRKKEEGRKQAREEYLAEVRDMSFMLSFVVSDFLTYV